MALGDAVRGTLRVNTSGRTSERMPFVRAEIIRHYAPNFPLCALVFGQSVHRSLSPVKQFPVKSEGKFEWIESDIPARSTTVSTAASSVATTLTVADAKIFSATQYLRVDRNGPAGNEGEILYITSVDSDTQLTVIRARQGTTAKAIEAGATLLGLGTGWPEDGRTSVGSIEGNRVLMWGATQHFRVEISETLRRRCMQTYVGYDWPEEMRVAGFRFFEQIESALWFNGPANITDTDGTYLTYSTAGINGVCTENDFDLQNCSYLEFVDAYLEYQRNNPRAGNELKPIVFGSNLAFSQLARWGVEHVQTRSGETKFGFDVRDVIVPGGTVPFVYTPILDGTSFENDIFGLNMADIELGYNQEGPPDNRSWNIRTIDENGEDITEIGSTTKRVAIQAVVGLKVQRVRRHFRIRRFSSR